ncbi:MAG: hypothetical protein HYU24_12085 [Candidatus Rokubacteria bacterium]|nr:hypothetical protein [Candidatus Rokubacteria bacterium]
MSGPKKPKKPARFPSHLAFPKRGPVRRVVEPLPQTQAELELAIGHKFLGALAHFHGIHFKDLTSGVEPADLRCIDDSGRTVSIQVVEAVNQPLRQLIEMRSEYLAALQGIRAGFAQAFSGCAVAIVDTGDPPYLPRVHTEAGRRCLDQIRAGFVQIGRSIGQLPVGRLTRRDVQVRGPDRTLSLLVTRHEAPSTPDRFALSWGGGGPVYRTDLPRDILPAAIRTKLAKRYVTADSRFILLVYSIDTLLTPEDPDVCEANRLLSTAKHPFGEAWYLYPYADASLGHVVKLWP